MPPKRKTFHSKILLFGEYSVMLGSKALSIPYPRFKGHFAYPDDAGPFPDTALETSRQNLLAFLSYLKNIKNPIFEEASLDLGRMGSELNQGLYFHSDIPQGYGVGSSGALVAAVYQEYAGKRIEAADKTSTEKLRAIFSVMESFFHGESSGMDPLNCYFGKPLLIGSGGEIELINLPSFMNKERLSMFLVDSGYPGETGPLVGYFKEKLREPSFKHTLFSELVPLNDSCIELFVAEKAYAFFSSLQRLSQLQLKIFRKMIPERFISLWGDAANSGDFLLKLCGSGGGGFLLGFTRDFSRVEKTLFNQGITVLSI